MNSKFRIAFTAAAAIATIGLGTSLQAFTNGPVELPPTDISVPINNIGPLTPGFIDKLAAPDFVASFTSGTVIGDLGVKVLSGVSENPFVGGLTFVYEIKNSSSLDPTRGISDFKVGGWAGLSQNPWVAFGGNSNGSDFFFSPSSNLISPETASFDGVSIDFNFPPGSNNPPIFAGENSFQLFVFTNATSWTGTEGDIQTADYDPIDGPSTSGSTRHGSVLTLTAASVPDGGMTAILLGFGLVFLSLFAPRLKLAKA